MKTGTSRDLYDNPRYYEIAFSFRDLKKEVDVFEECFKRFSKIPVRRVLDIGCGPSPHMEELARRGYQYVGLDNNKAMLEYSKKKAKDLGASATFVQSDMKSFELQYKVDFSFTMLGSIHARTTEDLLSHFSSVAKALRPGGLYFLDWCINFQWDAESDDDQNWAIEKDGVKVKMSFAKDSIIDRGGQIGKYTMVADVDDHGKKLRFETTETNRTIFPQEFLLLVDKSGAFDFVGWWNNWNLKEPIEKAKKIDRPIALILRL